jgi:ribosome-associated translation inhibitor RaiA
MTNIMIQYQGFHPTAFTQSYIESQLDALLHHAPHGAVMRAIFRRKRNVFAARVHLRSGGGSFFAAASSRHMREAARQIVARVGRQLERRQTLRQRRSRGQHDTDVA